MINVDIIVPVHNAADTIEEAVESALLQWIPEYILKDGMLKDGRSDDDEYDVGDSVQRFAPPLFNIATSIDVAVCCHDDGSTDDSLKILKAVGARHEEALATSKFRTRKIPAGCKRIRTRLLIGTNEDGVARGAGYARNRAAELRAANATDKEGIARQSFLCLLDSDDLMHPTRIAEQLNVMMSLPVSKRDRMLLGCTFDRLPAGSTWHYSEWANNLTDERLFLERYREVTLLQPTWFITRSRFEKLGGYVEAPHPNSMCNQEEATDFGGKSETDMEKPYRLIHAEFDSPHTLRLAEDLRFFHEHLRSSGLLKLCRGKPLVTYRHRAGQSQSSSTPRKLLLQLRVKAFEDTILREDPRWANGFIIWGAGRDGKDFFKSLSVDLRSKVRCFADIDEKKIIAGYYANSDLCVKVPIVHFSLLATNPDVREDEVESFGRIIKGKKDATSVEVETVGGSTLKKRSRPKMEQSETSFSQNKRQKKKMRKLHNLSPKCQKELNFESLQSLPVVVCVTMNRTQGALEKNVSLIDRIEGETLWHFS